MRDWAVKRRTRTRRLIELGGLVIKAGLVEMIEDDRAALFDAFLSAAEKLRGEEKARALAIWKQNGMQAFEAEAGINSAARASSTRAEGADA